jgi:hypothetical protein
MRKFVITNPTKWQGEIELGYNEAEILIYVSVKNDMNDGQLIELLKRLPIQLASLHLMAKGSTATINEMPIDLSFDAFWEAFGLKRNRFRAEKIWAKLSDATRTKAITSTTHYRNYLRRKNIFQLHADKYLHEQHYDTNWNSIQ